MRNAPTGVSAIPRLAVPCFTSYPLLSIGIHCYLLLQLVSTAIHGIHTYPLVFTAIHCYPLVSTPIHWYTYSLLSTAVLWCPLSICLHHHWISSFTHDFLHLFHSPPADRTRTTDSIQHDMNTTVLTANVYTYIHTYIHVHTSYIHTPYMTDSQFSWLPVACSMSIYQLQPDQKSISSTRLVAICA